MHIIVCVAVAASSLFQGSPVVSATPVARFVMEEIALMGIL